jgi:superfamily II DNA helicase RecQ
MSVIPPEFPERRGGGQTGAQAGAALRRKPTPAERLTDLLREVFCFEGFRPWQEAVCRAVTEGSDVLLVTPTGAGKSLCYQLPGVARGGTTLVRRSGALVRSGHVFERAESFEKDGRIIEFRRLFLSASGREAADLGDVPVAIALDASERRERQGKPLARADRERVAGQEPFARPERRPPPDTALLQALRAWRQAEARRRQVPAFCVLSNRTLEGIARARPEDDQTLLRVKGVGYKVVEQYGAAILERVRRCAPPSHRP